MSIQYIVLSIHDVTPKFNSEIKRISDEFDKRAFEARSFGIVPNYERNYDISYDNEFLSWLRKRQEKGDELIFHGYTHFSDKRLYKGFIDWFKGEIFSQGEAEFQNLDYDETKERLKKGSEIMEKLNISSNGFIPPCWITNKASRKAIKDHGFNYMVKSGRIEDFSNNRVIKSKAFFFASHTPFMCLLSRSYDFYLEHIHLMNNSLATIPIHPRNIYEKTSFNQCLDTVERLRDKGRKLVTYSQFLEEQE